MANNNALGGSGFTRGYIGTNARTPPNLWQRATDPTDFTIAGYAPGDFWLNTATESLFYLASVEATVASGGQQIANWVELSEGVDPVLDIVTDAGTATPVDGDIDILGGSNINTSAAGNVVTIDLDNTVSVSGSVTAGTGLTATTGDVTITAGNLTLPNTNGAGTQGEITLGGLRWISNFSGNTFIGAESGNTTVTSTTNVGIGSGTLESVTTSADNVAIGEDALTLHTTGSAGNGGNIAIGYKALSSSVADTQNTAIGFKSMEDLDGGDFNTAVGWSTLNAATTAADNIAIGRFTLGMLLTGTNNICIGQAAGNTYVGAESNNLILGGKDVIGDADTVRIASGTIFTPFTKVFIEGISGATIASSQPVFINTSTGQLGTIPSASTSPAFLAVLSATATDVTGNGAVYTVIPNTEISDRGANYNNATGVFTAPVAGYYQLWCYIPVTGATIATSIEIRIVTTGNTYVNTYDRPAAADDLALTLSVVAPMAATDTASLRVICSGEAADTDDVFGDGTTAGATFGGIFIS